MKLFGLLKQVFHLRAIWQIVPNCLATLIALTALFCLGSASSSAAYAQVDYAQELASCNKWVQGIEDMQRSAGHDPGPTDPAVCETIAAQAVALIRSCAGLGPAPGDPPFPQGFKQPSPAECAALAAAPRQ
jgi:hypothetical protein